jgi:hypothetical protein
MPATQISTIAQTIIDHFEIEQKYELSKELGPLINREQKFIEQRGGVINSSEDRSFIVLPITLQKDFDELINNVTLHWAGQTNQKFAEKYISKAETQIFIFIREKDHEKYTYYGRAKTKRIRLEPNGTPSDVYFDLYELAKIKNISPNIVQNSSFNNNSPNAITSTEAERNIMSRTVQYKFRNGSLELWENKCAVTQINCPKILIASHIKPWREATNNERIDKYNSLLLSPTYDKLFDLGLITFDKDSGKIILSDIMTEFEWNSLNIYSDQKLIKVPNQTKKYLDYHNKKIFKFNNFDSRQISF